jgi:ABC-type phosphate/phosphonate transport system permease subunit
VNEFVSNFLKLDKTQLAFRSVKLKRLWPFFPERFDKLERSAATINSGSTVWEAMEIFYTQNNTHNGLLEVHDADTQSNEAGRFYFFNERNEPSKHSVRMPDQQPSFLEFVRLQGDKILSQTLEHIGLTFISLFIAVCIGIPLGIFIAERKRWAGAVLGVAGILQTIPSIALLGIMIPLLGIGARPAIVALFLYALLPIIRNTYTGITGVNATVTEAAQGVRNEPTPGII